MSYLLYHLPTEPGRQVEKWKAFLAANNISPANIPQGSTLTVHSDGTIITRELVRKTDGSYATCPCLCAKTAHASIVDTTYPLLHHPTEFGLVDPQIVDIGTYLK